MIYTVHVGERTEEWPKQAGAAKTRSAACTLVKELLGNAAPNITKGEVRHEYRLLDAFAKRDTGTVRHLYAAQQRQRTKEEHEQEEQT